MPAPQQDFRQLQFRVLLRVEKEIRTCLYLYCFLLLIMDMTFYIFVRSVHCNKNMTIILPSEGTGHLLRWTNVAEPRKVNQARTVSPPGSNESVYPYFGGCVPRNQGGMDRSETGM